MPHRRINLMLIEDSAFMRKVISDLICTDTSIELVGVAKNGREGSEMASRLKPDVIVTDMIMPEYDGLYLVNDVMQRNPVPIILLSSLEKTDSRIFDALQRGAFDFIDKPATVEKLSLNDYPLLRLIHEAAQSDISILKAKENARKNGHKHTFQEHLNYDIAVIGASTGGPGAIEYILNNLPINLKIPVVVVQHMPHRFLESFVQRLNSLIPLPVQLARRGELLKNGTIYFAPGDTNLRIEQNIVSGQPMFTATYNKYQEYNFPSIDCLFESVASVYGKRSIGVVLTGMGKDGTMGLGKIHQEGGFTIAQDENSSIVYGMPKAAFESGCVKQVLPLNQVPGYIINCL